jgi:hypothetical protein
MTVLIPITALSTLIVVLAIRLLARSGKRQEPAVTIGEYAIARKALDGMFLQTEAVRRIFSVEDAEFIARSAGPDVQSLFLKERKKLAQQWVRKTRTHVARLMDLHLRLASYTYDPSPRFEFRLTAKYLTFMAVSNIVLLLLSLLGPFKASRSISYAARTAGSFCTSFSFRLERVNPTRLNSGRESLVH